VPWGPTRTPRPLCTSACGSRAIRRAMWIRSACCRRGPCCLPRSRRPRSSLLRSRRRLPSPWSNPRLPPRRRARSPRALRVSPPQRRSARHGRKLRPGPSPRLPTSPAPSHCPGPAPLSRRCPCQARPEILSHGSVRRGNRAESRDQRAGRRSARPKAPVCRRRPVLRSRVGVLVMKQAPAFQPLRANRRPRPQTSFTSR
jgi:hypothetical protein